MTHHVQEFIESTIDLIEKQEYHEVFTIWYLYYYDGQGPRGDYPNLQELFKVFDSIDIDLCRESETARKDIISEHMYEYIDDILANDSDTSEIRLPDVLKHLNSHLDLSLIDLNNMFKQVGQHIQGSFNVRIEPFKLVRNT